MGAAAVIVVWIMTRIQANFWINRPGAMDQASATTPPAAERCLPKQQEDIAVIVKTGAWQVFDKLSMQPRTTLSSHKIGSFRRMPLDDAGLGSLQHGQRTVGRCILRTLIDLTSLKCPDPQYLPTSLSEWRRMAQMTQQVRCKICDIVSIAYQV